MSGFATQNEFVIHLALRGSRHRRSGLRSSGSELLNFWSLAGSGSRPASRWATRVAACRVCPAAGVTVRPGTSSDDPGHADRFSGRNSWRSGPLPRSLRRSIRRWGPDLGDDGLARLFLPAIIGLEIQGRGRAGLEPADRRQVGAAGLAANGPAIVQRVFRAVGHPQYSVAVVVQVTVPPKSAISSLCMKSTTFDPTLNPVNRVSSPRRQTNSPGVCHTTSNLNAPGSEPRGNGRICPPGSSRRNS